MIITLYFVLFGYKTVSVPCTTQKMDYKDSQIASCDHLMRQMTLLCFGGC